MFCGCSERKEGSEYTGAIGVGTLEEEGFEGMIGLDRQKHKCSTGNKCDVEWSVGGAHQRRLLKPI